MPFGNWISTVMVGGDNPLRHFHRKFTDNRRLHCLAIAAATLTNLTARPPDLVKFNFALQGNWEGRVPLHWAHEPLTKTFMSLCLRPICLYILGSFRRHSSTKAFVIIPTCLSSLQLITIMLYGSGRRIASVACWFALPCLVRFALFSCRHLLYPSLVLVVAGFTWLCPRFLVHL